MAVTNLGKVTMTPRGEYAPEATYNRLDLVRFQGSSFIVLQDGVVGVTPSDDGQKYSLLAQKGDSGEQGAAGEKGEKGDTGAQGVPGEKGEKGEKGDTGAQGVPGEKGEKGEKGDTGAQGVPGEKGEKGEKGDTGAQGVAGEKGEKGEKGDTGAQGVPGERGEKGEKGVQGIQGLKGDTGERGEKGEKGDKGDTGKGLAILGKYESLETLKTAVLSPAPGDAYSVGAAAPYDIYIYDTVSGDWMNNGKLQGAKGEKGDPGEPGQDGAPGAKGDKGDPGEPGQDGTPGEKGEKGEKGDKGDPGAAGQDGKSAYQAALDGGFVGEESTFNSSLSAVSSKITAPQTATDGQVLTYRTDHWEAETPKEAGVSSFHGRTGAIIPQQGDYTAAQVGARPDTWTPTAADVGAIPTVNGAQGQLLGFTSANLVGAVDAPKSASKRTARFVVGTSTAGWTAEDCDYLCDGTDDQAEINAAIQALPSGGGEVVILDGTYNITANIEVNKAHTKLSGNGTATVLKTMAANVKIINITKDNCTITSLMCDGNKTEFSSTFGIYIDGSNNTITGNTCSNNNITGILVFNNNNTITSNTCSNNRNSGIRVSRDNNTITSNTCNNNNEGILISNSNNTITGNTCNNNNIKGINIDGNGSNNTITGNTCSNNSESGIAVSRGDNNTITGNTCNNDIIYGIQVEGGSDNNAITGNACNNNGEGIHIIGDNNAITGNACIRATGTSADYLSSQHTIRIHGKNNLITGNNCMGKAPVDSGTGNTLVNNKY